MHIRLESAIVPQPFKKKNRQHKKNSKQEFYVIPVISQFGNKSNKLPKVSFQFFLSHFQKLNYFPDLNISKYFQTITTQ